MTEREMLMNALARINMALTYDTSNYVEINSNSREDVCIEFDDDGNITDIYC